jgi:hypothetical protein
MGSSTKPPLLPRPAGGEIALGAGAGALAVVVGAFGSQ